MGNLKFLNNYIKGYLSAYLKPSKLNPNCFYKNLGILNPSIGTSNLGDLIIYESVYKILREIFPNDLLTNFPTQLYTTFDAMKLMSERDLLFVSGTNLLSSNLDVYNQWKIHQGHKKFLKNKVVLLGCGWWQYQGDVNNYSKDVYRSVLNKSVLHSVRDQYTVDKLFSIGIDNVINTSCPTLWDMHKDKCKLIPRFKGIEVITTLTCYNKDIENDSKMLEILANNYSRVYLWVQGLEDLNYFKSLDLNLNNIELLPPSIEAFNEILRKKNIDYIGTRLHAGIRALQNNVRSLILAVDNRALEIGKDVNLNVIKRKDVLEILNFIHNEYATEINLPLDNISIWKKSLFQ